MTPDERPSTPPPTLTNIGGTALEVGALLAGRYRVAEMLGLGAMGMVYRAHDEDLDLDVAVKVLRPELSGDAGLIERFRRELILARQVSHRNVVRIHDLGKDGELLFLTMDFVAGKTLRDVLRERGKLPVDEVTRIGSQLARALAAAHEQGIIHRDLKPSNVMVDDEGSAYVTDFGIARSVTSAALTRTGLVVGTPGYLAPEQIRGEELDGRCDVFALGVLLRELLMGDAAVSPTADEAIARSMHGTSTALRGLGAEVPAALKAILGRALEPDRRRRYATAEEMARDLETLSRPPRRLPARHTLAAVAAVLVLVAGLALGVPVLRSWLARPAAAPGAAATVEQLPTLAVLPFSDETNRPETAWLGAGIPEILFESLVSHPNLRVVDPQRVVRALADLKLDPGRLTDANLEQAAELFDAGRILTGRVRPAGKGLRIEARLSSPAAGQAATVPLLVEDAEGARSPAQLVRALEEAVLDKLTLRPDPSAEPVTLDSTALPAYSEGVRRLQQGDLVGARERLEEAVAADSGFGPALLDLARAYEGLGLYDEALATADRAIEALPEGRLGLAARAAEARLSGDAARSTELLAELVERYPTDLESSVELADALGMEGRFKEALERLERVVEAAPSHPRAWYLMSKFSIRSGDARRAVDEYLVRAMVIQNKLRNRQGQADVLNAYGVAYRELGEIEQAEESYRRAAGLRREVGDQRGYATTLRNLSHIAVFRGNYEAAERDLVEARAILEQLGDVGGIADIHNDLGMLEEARGRYAESLEQFREALQARRRLGNQRAIAESLNNIGFANHELGNYDDAEVYWKQALEIYQQTGNLKGEVVVRQSLGRLETTRGEWTDATRSYLQALEASRELDWTAATAASEGALGQLAHRQGRHAAALAYYDDALERFESLEEPRGYLEFGLAKAETLLDLGLTGQATALLGRLEERLAAVGSSDQKARHELLHAEALYQDGDRAGAQQALSRAGALAAESGNRALELTVELARIAGQNGLGRLAQVYDELVALGNVELELEAGELLVARLLAAGDAERAAERLAGLNRTLRRVGDYGGAYRVYRLEERLAEVRGGDRAVWRQRAAAELDRLRQGLSTEQAAALAARVGKMETKGDESL